VACIINRFTVKCLYIFTQLFWPGQMSVVYKEKISFNVLLHGQMSVKMSKCLFLRTFDCEFEVYNRETQFYGHMTVKHLFITQATGHIKIFSTQLTFYTCKNLCDTSRFFFQHIKTFLASQNFLDTSRLSQFSKLLQD
jgi:hypothetical protein